MADTKMVFSRNQTALKQLAKLAGLLCLLVAVILPASGEDSNSLYAASESRFPSEADAEATEVRLGSANQRLANKLQSSRPASYDSGRYILREVSPEGMTFTPKDEAWIDILEDLSSHIPLPHLSRSDQLREPHSSTRILRGVEWIPVVRESSRQGPVGLEFPKQVIGATKNVVIRAVSQGGSPNKSGQLAADPQLRHPVPVSQQRLGPRIQEIEGAVDLEWKRQENSRWNNLRGMWG